METWYLLFDGSSPDGMGQGEFVGRTTNKDIAKAHYKRISKNPYNTGSVYIVTDKIHTIASPSTAWENL